MVMVKATAPIFRDERIREKAPEMYQLLNVCLLPYLRIQQSMADYEVAPLTKLYQIIAFVEQTLP